MQQQPWNFITKHSSYRLETKTYCYKYERKHNSEPKFQYNFLWRRLLSFFGVSWPDTCFAAHQTCQQTILDPEQVLQDTNGRPAQIVSPMFSLFFLASPKMFSLCSHFFFTKPKCSHFFLDLKKCSQKIFRGFAAMQQTHSTGGGDSTKLLLQHKSLLHILDTTLTCLKSDPWSVPSFSGRRNYFEDAPEKSEDALRSLFTCVGRCLRGTLFPWDGRFLIPYITCCTVPCLPSECS